MLSVLWTIGLFLFAIMVLVTVHEFGHFIVARGFKVKVLRFSVGFGKKLGSFYDKKGTEYVIAAIPLGGYVKMLDEREGPVKPEEIPFAFNRKSPLVRIAIVCAGPLFNFLFAIFAYWLMFVIGFTTYAPLIGNVEPHSIAYNAGIQPGFEIIAINNEKIDDWQDVRLALLSYLGDSAKVTFTLKSRTSAHIENKTVDLSNWHMDDELQLLKSVGIHAYIPAIPLIIQKVIEDSPASRAGLHPEDELLAINSKPLSDWKQMVEYVADRPHQEIQLTVRRNQQNILIPIQIGQVEVNGKARGFLGVQSMIPNWPADLIRKKHYSPLKAWIPAVEKTWEMTSLSFQFLGKMLTGELSVNNMSGPIGIAEGAHYSASLGIAYFMSFLALISISLAVINILPIPILDGGHLMYYLYELITKKPVSEKVQAIATQIGIFLLLAVMILAFYNDITRW